MNIQAFGIDIKQAFLAKKHNFPPKKRSKYLKRGTKLVQNWYTWPKRGTKLVQKWYIWAKKWYKRGTLQKFVQESCQPQTVGMSGFTATQSLKLVQKRYKTGTLFKDRQKSGCRRTTYIISRCGMENGKKRPILPFFVDKAGF